MHLIIISVLFTKAINNANNNRLFSIQQVEHFCSWKYVSLSLLPLNVYMFVRTHTHTRMHVTLIWYLRRCWFCRWISYMFLTFRFCWYLCKKWSCFWSWHQQKKLKVMYYQCCIEHWSQMLSRFKSSVCLCCQHLRDSLIIQPWRMPCYHVSSASALLLPTSQ